MDLKKKSCRPLRLEIECGSAQFLYSSLVERGAGTNGEKHTQHPLVRSLEARLVAVLSWLLESCLHLTRAVHILPVDVRPEAWILELGTHRGLRILGTPLSASQPACRHSRSARLRSLNEKLPPALHEHVWARVLPSHRCAGRRCHLGTAAPDLVIGTT